MNRACWQPDQVPDRLHLFVPADDIFSNDFDNEELFPPGSVAFDSPLLMWGLRHEWNERPLLDISKLPCGYWNAAVTT